MSAEPAEARVKQLSSELRCLVCQNQSIADSNAPLAVDLRTQIVSQIQAGRSDAEIKQYMVERYGEFVLYKPLFNPSTLALWAGPFLLLLVGIVLARRVIAKGRSLQSPQLDPARANALEARYHSQFSSPRSTTHHEP
jgi:cytochrome c-type biogenesis protein CcmH